MRSIVELLKGDITKVNVGAIVNAANSSLMGGGGVDGAIHRAGGPEILQACMQLNGCPTGQAVITTAGNLPAKKVIHTVGPVWHGGKNNEENLLANCYRSSLLVAVEHRLRSIAFPNISTGVYGFPKQRAATVAINTVNQFLSDNPNAFDRITFVCFDDDNFQIYSKIISEQDGN